MVRVVIRWVDVVCLVDVVCWVDAICLIGVSIPVECPVECVDFIGDISSVVFIMSDFIDGFCVFGVSCSVGTAVFVFVVFFVESEFDIVSVTSVTSVTPLPFS